MPSLKSKKNILSEMRLTWENAKISSNSAFNKGMDAIKFINNHTCPANQYLYIVDYTENKITHTKGVEVCLGYSTEEFTVTSLMGYIHADDRNVILPVVQVMWEELVKGTYNYTSTSWGVMFDYRIRKKDGTYIKIFQQVFFTDINEKGQVIRTLDLCTDISHIKQTNFPTYKIMGENIDSLFEKIEERLGKYKIFSPREAEIIAYTCEGKTSKQIAQKLEISDETVRTYKKRIYQKTGCHNSSELVSHLFQTGGVN